MDENNIFADVESTDEKDVSLEQLKEEAEIPKKSLNLSKPAVAVISSVATLLVCVLIVAIAYGVGYNKYNANIDKYLPTLEDTAKEYEVDIDELKEAYGLPKNMRGDTVFAAAVMYMPAGLYVEMNHRIPFDVAVETFGLAGDERITPEMRYGEFVKILEETPDPEPASTEAQASEAPADGEAPAESEEAPESTEEAKANE